MAWLMIISLLVTLFLPFFYSTLDTMSFGTRPGDGGLGVSAVFKYIYDL